MGLCCSCYFSRPRGKIPLLSSHAVAHDSEWGLKGFNLNYGVQEGDGVQEHRPAGVIGVVEGVLRDVRVRSLQAGPDTLRWFVCEFERHLKILDIITFIDLYKLYSNWIWQTLIQSYSDCRDLLETRNRFKKSWYYDFWRHQLFFKMLSSLNLLWTISIELRSSSAVFFNLGSAEPRGSANF